MLFIETPIFTKLVTDLIPDDEYRKIQLALVLRPEAGKIITGSGGLRKIRWKRGAFQKNRKKLALNSVNIIISDT